MDAYSPKQPQQSQKTFIAIGLVVFAAVAYTLYSMVYHETEEK